jgi:CRISPR/Cas system endoribonuclease Cas6 (RAMP superfamily)
VLSAKTPIVISLDSFVWSKFGITLDKDKLLYRVKDHGFEVRVRQLHKNILRKYVLLCEQWYTGKLTDRDKTLIALYQREDRSAFDDFCAWCNFFSWYKYRRNAVVKYKEWFIGWSVWDLVIADDIHWLRVLKYVLPIGLGERCTTGFGWMG